MQGRGTAFELFDDDSAVLPVTPDTSLMADKYKPAYILPVVDGGGKASNNKQTVAFKRNLSSDNSAALGAVLTVADAMESDANRRNDFWIAYVLQAWQGEEYSTVRPTDPRGDRDPDTEPALGGVTTALNGKGSFSFFEELTDEFLGIAVNTFAVTVAHETAHEFGLEDCGPNPPIQCVAPDMMGTGFELPNSKFNDRDLRNLRKRVKSPGR